MIDFKKRCADCACLIEKNGEWLCDECFGQKCSDVDDCPYGLTAEEVEQAQTLTAEQKKAVKKATITTSVDVDKKVKKERKPKENPEKEALIWEIASRLEDFHHMEEENLASYVENVTITNKTREIAFKCGENEYKITLTATRKPKTEKNA